MRTLLIAAVAIVGSTATAAADCSHRNTAAGDQVRGFLSQRITGPKVIGTSNLTIVNTGKVNRTCVYMIDGAVHMRDQAGKYKDGRFTIVLRFDTGEGVWSSKQLLLFDN